MPTLTGWSVIICVVAVVGMFALMVYLIATAPVDPTDEY